MPPKAKSSSKAAAQTDLKGQQAESSIQLLHRKGKNHPTLTLIHTATASNDPPPENIAQRSTQRFYQTNPLGKRLDEVGIQGLTPAERKTHAHASLIVPVSQDRVPLSNKAEREYWRSVTKEGLPIRRLRRDYDWGKDKRGRELSTYKIGEFEQRGVRCARLTALDLLHRQFLAKRDKAAREGVELSDEEIQKEKDRRKEMAALSTELYGRLAGSLAQDPVWDDVIPIPLNEPEGALAQIAYPDKYAEGM
jgi:protein farnesyltransferase/geranylgeranyltransferase type-1 subunit alpha